MPIFNKARVIPHSEPPNYSLSLDEFVERLDAENKSQYQQLLKTKQEQLKQVMQTSAIPEANAAFSDRASTTSTSAVYSPSAADDTERRVRSETELLHAPPIELYPINGFQKFFADKSDEELQFTDTTENVLLSLQELL